MLRSLKLPTRHAMVATFALCAMLIGPATAHAQGTVRLKDLAGVQGMRMNQLIGYGLVVGLDGSGDQTTQTPFTTQSLQTMLTQLGVNLPPGINLQLRNVAAVMVTASLPAFAQPGQAIDITVSSLGNAKSLRGGTLLMTPLKGADGRVYALAQGNVAVGGAGASAGGSKAQINHLAAGRVPNGATIERGVASSVGEEGQIRLELVRADFGVATRVSQAINEQLAPGAAQALDARTIAVAVPLGSNERVAFLSRLEALAIDPGEAPARVVVNARTGSVVMNRAVRLEPCAVAHGNLSVTIQTTPEVSQPAPFSQGQTVVTGRSDIQIRQDGGAIAMLQAGADLAQVVKALNTLGANPQDLLAILQALHTAGALRADLEVI